MLGGGSFKENVLVIGHFGNRKRGKWVFNVFRISITCGGGGLFNKFNCDKVKNNKKRGTYFLSQCYARGHFFLLPKAEFSLFIVKFMCHKVWLFLRVLHLYGLCRKIMRMVNRVLFFVFVGALIVELFDCLTFTVFCIGVYPDLG